MDLQEFGMLEKIDVLSIYGLYSYRIFFVFHLILAARIQR
jgi:hypothetical protein